MPAPPVLTTLNKGVRVFEDLTEADTSSATLTTLSRALLSGSLLAAEIQVERVPLANGVEEGA